MFSIRCNRCINLKKIEKQSWKTAKIEHFVSKYNSKRKKEVFLLMITNGEGWHIFQQKNYQHFQEE